MNCKKCKKFDSKNRRCNMDSAETQNMECYLKMLYRAIRENSMLQIKMVAIFSDMLEIQKVVSKKYMELLNKEINDKDEGEDWKNGTK